HLRSHVDRRIQLAYALLGLVTHPLAVIAHVLCEPLSARPFVREEFQILARLRIHGWPAGKLWRDLDHRLVDPPRDRIEIARTGHQAKALSLERNRPAAGEWVVERRQHVSVEELACTNMVSVLRAGPAPTLPNLLARPVQDIFVCRVLPLDEIFDDL